MATTVHIPPQILQTVDAEARKRRVSRNRYIVEALVARVAADRDDERWPQSLFEEMRRWRGDRQHAEAARELGRIIASSKRSKKAVAL